MNLIWIKFIICSLIILFAGRNVARCGDVIAEKTGLSGLWVGLLLLAVATSLPEIFTGIGSIVFLKNPDLTVGNLFGANSYNLLNIALLDFLHRDGTLLSVVSSGHILTVWFSLVPVVIAGIGIFLGSKFSSLSFVNISIFSFLILFFYLFAINKIYVFEKGNHSLEKKPEKYQDETLKNAILFYSINAIVIVAAGIWLAYIGGDIARSFKLNSSFVGSLLLGFTTSLPEIVVSIAALRMGAREMALANMLGSNLFNMTVIFINDLLYREAPIFSSLSSKHIFSCFIVMMMTAVVAYAIISKPKKKWLNLSLSSYCLIAIFIVGVLVNFKLGKI